MTDNTMSQILAAIQTLPDAVREGMAVEYLAADCNYGVVSLVHVQCTLTDTARAALGDHDPSGRCRWRCGTGVVLDIMDLEGRS